MISLSFKILRWLISVIALILGVYFMNMASIMETIKPLAGAMLCFAIVFWMSKVTYEASKRVFFTTVGLLVISGMLSYFFLQGYLLHYINIGFYMTWALAITIMGIPAMVYTYKKDD